MDIYSKHTWIIPLADKKSKTNLNTNCALTRVLNSAMVQWNFFYMIIALAQYCTENEEKWLIVKRFLYTSKNQIYKGISVIGVY